jgi:hypothetical protein
VLRDVGIRIAAVDGSIARLAWRPCCSLGLAVGATTAAFRLLDAVLLRTLPVAEPDRLFALGWNSITSQGEADYRDDFDYPTFRRYRDAVGASGT